MLVSMSMSMFILLSTYIVLSVLFTLLCHDCLGALDGTHINILVSSTDKPCESQIATNTLAVCDRNMQFVYVLPGWEGSAGDSRVLSDDITQKGGLKVPQGW